MTTSIEMERFSTFGLQMLESRYLLKGEKPVELFQRVANAYSDNKEHAERILSYMLKCWFMPATPILSNGGTKRGLPISCFLNECEDSLKSIDDLWHENTYLASRGGGIGSYWGNVRSIGEKISINGYSSGIIPFIKVMDSLTLAISQGSLRRGSAAVYLDVSHPEIEEFIDIRKPTGGDPNRRCLNIHHAVTIDDKFMDAVTRDLEWELISPNTKQVISKTKARDLWTRILTMRLETGEPYILFKDNVKKDAPETYKYFNLDQKTSNLCAEITLTTGLDHLGKKRTGVCCLSSLNLEYFDEWKTDENIIKDVLLFLDNVMDDFIKRSDPEMKNAKYSAERERSVGLGVMGFHSYLQKNMVPFESAIAKSMNMKMFDHIRSRSDKASKEIAIQKGPCHDNFDMIVDKMIKNSEIKLELTPNLYHEYTNYLNGKNFSGDESSFEKIKAKIVTEGERFTHKLAVAPTASISEICGGCSPGIEPFIANTFNKKNLTGTGVIRNKYLNALLKEKGYDSEETWQNIVANEGSVQQLDFLDFNEKQVFKTAFELDQAFLVELAADRTKYICQAQSLNIFLPSIVSKTILHKIHYIGWQKGIKSFYYCRSRSVGRGEKVNQVIEKMESSFAAIDNGECLACQ